MTTKITKKTVLLLAGKANSGKDTAANHLVSNYSFTRFAFADALKDFVAEKYNIQKAFLYSQEGKKMMYQDTGKTLRDLLIEEGLAHRKIDPDYWIKIVCDKINTIEGNAVISDFRFPNEHNTLVENLEKCNIKTVCIIRENGAETIDDISETSLSDFKFDKVWFNDRTIYDLNKSIDNDITELM